MQQAASSSASAEVFFFCSLRYDCMTNKNMESDNKAMTSYWCSGGNTLSLKLYQLLRSKNPEEKKSCNIIRIMFCIPH